MAKGSTVTPRSRKRPAQGRPQKNLPQLAQAMASSLDLKTVFREFIGGIKGHIACDRISVDRVERKGRISRLLLVPSLPREGAASPKRGETVTAWVVRNKKPFIRKDILTKSVFETDRQLGRIDMRSYVSVPLIKGERVVGSLLLASRRAMAYGQKELQFLVPLAGWLAIAIENSRLFRESRALSKRYQRLLKEAKGKNVGLSQATEYKSQFLARMSHEVRTPLGVLIGFLDILGTENLGPLNEGQKSAVDKMMVQSRRLQKMINDVLNLSRIEEGTIPLEITTFQTETLIEALRPLADDLQRRSPLKVVWDIGPDLPLLTTDGPMLEEVLQNLIINAFKYTPEGEVRIRIKNRPTSNAMEFSVEDTGKGIAPDDLSKIFEGFHQVNATSTGQGVGLGLTIVKRYLEILKGQIQVQSEPGKGSTFTVTIPHKLVDRESRPSAATG